MPSLWHPWPLVVAEWLKAHWESSWRHRQRRNGLIGYVRTFCRPYTLYSFYSEPKEMEETEAERPSLVSICEWARAPVRLEIMGPVLSGWTDHSSSEEGYYGLEPEHPSQAIDSGLGVSMEQGSHWRVASVQGRACVGQSFRVKLGTLKTLEHCCPDDLPCPRQSYAKLCD